MVDMIRVNNTQRVRSIYVWFVLLMALQLVAAPVANSDAKLVAEKFATAVLHKDSSSFPQQIVLKSGNSRSSYDFFVYRYTNGGFVIISNDDNSLPIIGYSDTNEIPENIENPAFAEMLASYDAQIKAASKMRSTNDSIADLWERAKEGDFGFSNSRAAVTPLVATRWNQGSGWNALAPVASGGPGGRAYAGCVAVTMAQIMKFWGYPSTGNGSNTYTPSGFPTQSVNFAAQTYNYAAMSNTTYGAEVQKLLYHAGVAINMMYSATGSGAYTYWPGHKSAYDALINNFRFANTIQGRSKSSYSEANWIALLKTELDAGRPIAYSGYGSGGHSFICDGYNASNYFHFNWGWGGYADGYFAVTNLNPAGSSFTNGQEAMIGIKPAANLAPTANGDSYFVFVGHTLTTTTANGVLKNDSDANGDAITAVKLSNPAQGNLTFNANGTFTYVAPSQAGTYTFTYRSSDASLNSSDVTVTIVVSDFGETLGGLSGTSIYYGNNLLSWSKIAGTLNSLVVGDFDGDGYKDDLAGLSSGKIYYTTNLTSWKNIPGTLQSLVVGDFNPNRAGDELAGLGSGKIYYTTNMTSWTNIPGTLQSLIVGNFNASRAGDELAGLGSGRIYYTTNMTSWTNILGVLNSLIAGDFNASRAGDELAGLGSGKIYYTTNMSGWTNIPGTLQTLVAGNFNSSRSGDELAGLGSGLIYYTNNMSSWTNIPGGLNSLIAGDFNPNRAGDELAGIGSGKIYYTTNMSIWTNIPGIFSSLLTGDFAKKMANSSPQKDVYKEVYEVDKTVELAQNYPNPFNATTVINFVTSEKMKTQLKVFNAKGEMVKVLFDNLSEVGVNSVTFNAIDLTSGIYFYQLTIRDNIVTKKMILTK